jgi:hypothetical protein
MIFCIAFVSGVISRAASGGFAANIMQTTLKFEVVWITYGEGDFRCEVLGIAL